MSRPGFRISAGFGSFVLFDVQLGYWIRPDEPEEIDDIPVEFGFATPCDALEADDPVFREVEH